MSTSHAHSFYRLTNNRAIRTAEICIKEEQLRPQNHYTRPAPGAGWAPMPAFTSITGEQNVLRSRQLGPPRAGWRMRFHLPGPSPQVSQVGRSSIQAWIRTCPNPLSHPRQPIGARLVTCPGLWATCQKAPISTPRWPTPACRQESVLTRRPFFFHVFATPEPSWPGCGNPALAAWRPKSRARIWWSANQQLRGSEPLSTHCGPSMGGRVTFHTFTLPEDRSVRLLVKNLGRGTPESVVQEELESLNIRVQGVTQLRSGRRDQDPAKERPPTPT